MIHCRPSKKIEGKFAIVGLLSYLLAKVARVRDRCDLGKDRTCMAGPHGLQPAAACWQPVKSAPKSAARLYNQVHD